MVLALGVASFCLVVLLGLLPTGLNVQSSSTRETGAINVATGIVEDLQPGQTNSPRYGLSVPAAAQGVQRLLFLDEGGSPTNAEVASFAVVVTMLGDATVTRAHVLVAWPGAIAAKFSTDSAYVPGGGQADLRSQFRLSAGGAGAGSVEIVASLPR